MFYAYILRSEPYPSRVYHGHTADLRRRLTDHNSGDIYAWMSEEQARRAAA